MLAKSTLISLLLFVLVSKAKMNPQIKNHMLPNATVCQKQSFCAGNILLMSRISCVQSHYKFEHNKPLICENNNYFLSIKCKSVKRFASQIKFLLSKERGWTTVEIRGWLVEIAYKFNGHRNEDKYYECWYAHRGHDNRKALPKGKALPTSFSLSLDQGVFTVVVPYDQSWPNLKRGDRLRVSMDQVIKPNKDFPPPLPPGWTCSNNALLPPLP